LKTTNGEHVSQVMHDRALRVVPEWSPARFPTADVREEAIPALIATCTGRELGHRV
jgi:hypothetical protein